MNEPFLFQPLRPLALLERTRRSWGYQLSEMLGFVPPDDRRKTLLTSFCQLRLLALLGLVVMLGLTLLTGLVVFDEVKLDVAGPFGAVATLFAMRSLEILGGASPTGPILFCAAVAYVWARGRMSRLALAHGVSRLSPENAVVDLVSTPIRAILHAGAPRTHGPAHAAAAVERRVVNAILRPITGPYYVSALAILAFLPGLLFFLKPLSTVEREAGTWLLAVGLGLSLLLIGNTFIQLVQYWIGLEQLLKLILQHRLGRAFTRVAPFVRDSVEDQMSRSPHDLLRLCSCATLLDDLVRGAVLPRDGVVSAEALDRLRDHATEATVRRNRALGASSRSAARAASSAEARLGRQLVEACRELVELLTPLWEGWRDPGRPPELGDAPAERLSFAWSPGKSEPPPALAAGDASPEPELPERWRYTDAERRWLRDAEAFVATVTALILNRHVRQFQYFVYTLTGCSLLLLCAVSSYVFEPHRLLLTCIWAIVGSVVVLGLWVYLQIDRNSLLSRIAGTTPGKLTWNATFVVRIVTWGIIPLLGVAAVQYPDLANQVFSIVEPWTRALR